MSDADKNALCSMAFNQILNNHGRQLFKGESLSMKGLWVSLPVSIFTGKEFMNYENWVKLKLSS